MKMMSDTYKDESVDNAENQLGDERGTHDGCVLCGCLLNASEFRK